uniref:Uncharacterized protein n=1 Tax=Ditylenchus dipsaci TaxID=166011 RepID=A0A915EBU8_9BILA
MGNSQFRDIALETVAFVQADHPWKRELAQEVNITFNRISGLLFYDFPEYKVRETLADCLVVVNSMALTPLVTSTHVAASKSLVLMINDAVSQSTDLLTCRTHIPMEKFVNFLLAFVSTLSIKLVCSVFSRNPSMRIFVNLHLPSIRLPSNRTFVQSTCGFGPRLTYKCFIIYPATADITAT